MTDPLTDSESIYGYGRVSTDKQDANTQISALLIAAGLAGLALAEGQILVDSGVSGSAQSRPAFDRLKAAILTGRARVVLVTKLDRIARSVRTALEFFDLCESHGVRLIATEQQIDTSSPSGRLVRTVLAAVAEFEGELIRDRTLVAMREIKAGRKQTRSGRPVGRPRRVTAEKANQIAQLRNEDVPWAETAMRTGLPAETCRRTFYDLKSGRVTVDNSASGKTLVRHSNPPERGEGKDCGGAAS